MQITDCYLVPASTDIPKLWVNVNVSVPLGYNAVWPSDVMSHSKGMDTSSTPLCKSPIPPPKKIKMGECNHKATKIMANVNSAKVSSSLCGYHLVIQLTYKMNQQ